MKQILYLLFFILFYSGCQKVTMRAGQFMMQPYFKPDDRIVIDKTTRESYDYGDVVICQFEDREDRFYILRVVGLPGDSLGMEDYTCIINGKKNPRQFIADSVTFYHGRSLEYANEICEEFPNEKRINLYVEREVKVSGYYIQEAADIKVYVSEASFSPVEIPPNHYYVLGDTRARAVDSRLFGSVAKKNIKGRVIKVISSKEKSER